MFQFAMFPKLISCQLPEASPVVAKHLAKKSYCEAFFHQGHQNVMTMLYLTKIASMKWPHLGDILQLAFTRCHTFARMLVLSSLLLLSLRLVSKRFEANMEQEKAL